MLLLRLAKTAVYPLVHEKEKLFLAFRAEPMDFVQKENTVIGLVNQTLSLPFSPGERTLLIAEELRLQ